MKRIFHTYYKPWLIFFSLVVSLALLVAGSPKAGGLMYSLTFVLLMSIGSGGIYHFFSEYVRPRWIRHLISRPRLRYLIDLGFTFNQEDFFYFSEYQSYYITIEADSNLHTGDAILISACVRATEVQKDTLQKLNYEINCQEGLCWITYRIMLFRNTPKRKTLEKKLNQLVQDLEEKNIPPTPIKGGDEDTFQDSFSYNLK